MRLPQVEIRQAESLGRNNTGAVGRVASAISAKTRAETAVINNLAKVGGEFIRREETAKFNTALMQTNILESKYIEQEGVKEFFTGEELKGRVKNVDLEDVSSDINGKEVRQFKKSIPSYQVYPQLLNNKLRGDMDAIAKTIPNPLDRQTYVEKRSVAIEDRVRGATLKAAREQQQVLKQESDSRRNELLANGDIGTANIEAQNYPGSEFEVNDRLKDNLEKKEIWDADRLIQIEDFKGISDMLEYLQEPDYKEKGGPLAERPNIDLQNRLKSKLQSLTVRKGAQDKVYKEELRQRAQDMIKVLENGGEKTPEEIDLMKARLSEVGLNALSIDVRRADKKSAFVDFLKKTPVAKHAEVLNNLLGDETDEGQVRKEWLLNKSSEIEKEINSDANGLYQKVNFSKAPGLEDPLFFKKSVQLGKEASKAYDVKAKPLPDVHARSLSDKFKFATIGQKTGFIQNILTQVGEKSDRDEIFTQIDQKGAGNLNVYADIIERGNILQVEAGENEIIKAISEGKKLRADSALKLMPKNIDNKLNIALNKVFSIVSERTQYAEAIKDYYAKLANDNSMFDKEIVDSNFLDDALKSVVGNIVEYDGQNFLLPDNVLTFDTFESWIEDIDPSYIDEIGGVDGLESDEVIRRILDEELKLRPSLVRGQYLLEDARGNIVLTKDKKGRSVNFRFIYDTYARKKDKSMPFDEFQENQP